MSGAFLKIDFYVMTLGVKGSSNSPSGYIYGIPSVITSKIIEIPSFGSLPVSNSAFEFSNMQVEEFIIEPLY